MRNLIPEFLADTDASEGSFPDLGCIFLDISGFTAMSSKLSPHEKAGAEVLSQIINTLFTPLVAHVYRDSGVITGFAGDAFSAIFPHHSPDQLLKTARGLQAIVHQLQLQRTRFGDFTLQATIGLGWGPVTWQILEMQDTENILYVHGAGPTSAAHAAYHADPGWIAAQNSLQLSAESRPINADYRRIMVRPLPVSHSTTPNQTPLPAGLQARFRPLSQLPNTDSGEFRTVSCLFASLPNPCSDPSVTDFTAAAAAAAARHGGYFDAVDCSDKGPIAL
ncbi:MAG: adenylate/guanylate cyclase domain-containing protein, partial [Spirochaeta sp.]